MSSIDFTITSSNYTTAQTFTINTGETLNIEGTVSSTTAYGVRYNTTNIPGCSYSTIAPTRYSSRTVYTLSGTPTTVGTYTLTMCKRTSSISNGATITINVIDSGGGSTCKVNVNGTWKDGEVYINVNGVWKKANSVWINVNGVWRKNA